MLCVILSNVAGEAEPEPEAGLISVINKSTTHLPNKYLTQLSTVNVDPTQGYYNPAAGAYLHNINPYEVLNPYQSLNLPLFNPLQNLPYFSSPLANGFRNGYPDSSLGYSLSPLGDSGWTFTGNSGLRAYNPFAYNNLVGWSNADQLLMNARINYPFGPLSYLPGINNFNALALNRYNNLHHGTANIDESSVFKPPTYYPSLLMGAALHNAHHLGKSKESLEYKKKHD